MAVLSRVMFVCETDGGFSACIMQAGAGKYTSVRVFDVRVCVCVCVCVCERDRERERHTERERQTDRQTDRQTETGRERQ